MGTCEMSIPNGRPLGYVSSVAMHLTKAETKELARLEATIAEGLNTFVAVGNALVQIRDKRLYRETHETFELYCRDKWGFSKTHANRLIASAQAVEQIGHIEVVPANEAQARPLTMLPPQQQAEAWKRAVTAAGGKTPTAKTVREAVEAVLGASSKESTRPDVRFVNRVRLVSEFQKWAEKERIPAHTIKLVVGWLNEHI